MPPSPSRHARLFGASAATLIAPASADPGHHAFRLPPLPAMPSAAAAHAALPFLLARIFFGVITLLIFCHVAIASHIYYAASTFRRRRAVSSSAPAPSSVYVDQVMSEQV